MEKLPEIERAYRMRCYPTARQRRVLARLFGASRFVWNWALERRRSAYRCEKTRLNWVALSQEFTQLRRLPETRWLSELPREPFNQVLRDLEKAYENFFARRARHPRFHGRRHRRSVRFTLDQRRRQLERGGDEGRWAYVTLPGLGRVKLRRTETLEGRLRSVSLSCDGAGRYFAAITADRVPQQAWSAPRTHAVGVDMGLSALAVVHDGQRIGRTPAPKALAAKLIRLRRYQRRQRRQLAAQMRTQGLDPRQRCPKGVRLGLSRRRARSRERIARLHGCIRQVRAHALHQLSTTLVRRAEVIVLEDLRVKAMARGMGRRAFRCSVADAALGELSRQIEYKAGWAGRTLIRVDAFYPSSKRCSECGHIHAGLRLERHWECPACGARHDRDENAAKNLRREGLRILAGSSPATGKRRVRETARGAVAYRGQRPEREVRGVDCVAEPALWVTTAPCQPHPMMNREPARRPARAETPRALSGTA